MTRVYVFALFAACCLFYLTAAQPLDDESGHLLTRSRRSPSAAYRRGTTGRRSRTSYLYAARSQDAPAFAAPEEEEPASALSGEEAPADDVPSRNGRSRRPSSSAEEDGGAPPAYGNQQRSGTNAIATSYSRGAGASSNSHAIAYGGTFSGGQFKHRFQRT